MKTNQEIQTEAQELMVLGRQFQTEQRIASAHSSPRGLMTLPLNPALPGREQQIEAAITGGVLVFRLMERDTRDTEGTLLASSPSAYDVLSTGYEMAEEERLAASLERYAERSEERSDPADDETVAEVEAILEAKSLPFSDQLRTKVEVVEFLEGRLEPNALIARNIERQCSRECHREQSVERHELKLTRGEP